MTGSPSELAIGDSNAEAAVAILRQLNFCDLATTDLGAAVAGGRAGDPLRTRWRNGRADGGHRPPPGAGRDRNRRRQRQAGGDPRRRPTRSSRHAAFVPGHPIAGTEFSGPEAGFAELFRHRWCVLTPLPETPLPALSRVQALWEAVGAEVTVMTPEHHDRVLAMTSHLPHLIAFAICQCRRRRGRAYGARKCCNIPLAASAASPALPREDPVMWRDIFLNNRAALLDQLQSVAGGVGGPDPRDPLRGSFDVWKRA